MRVAGSFLSASTTALAAGISKRNAAFVPACSKKFTGSGAYMRSSTSSHVPASYARDREAELSATELLRLFIALQSNCGRALWFSHAELSFPRALEEVISAAAATVPFSGFGASARVAAHLDV